MNISIFPLPSGADIVRERVLERRTIGHYSHLLGLWILVLFSLICNSCGDKPEAASKTTLDAAVAQAQKDFAEANTEAIADLFVATTEQEKEAIARFAKSISEGEMLLQFTPEGSMTSGEMGVVLVRFEQRSTQWAFYAKREATKWRFFFTSMIWVDLQQLKQAKLSKADMKDALILHRWVAQHTQVGASGIGARERLGWYLPYLPKSLVIKRFFETPSPAMDHEYMWEIKIQDTDDFKKFTEQLTGELPNSAGSSRLTEVSKYASHPEWWRTQDFSQNPLHRHFVTVVGSNGGEKAWLFAMLDREAGFLYIQAF